MFSLWVQIGIRARCAAAVLSCVLAAWLLLSGLPVLAQSAAPPPVAAAPAQPAPTAKPGVLESIGRWFDKGAADLRDSLRGAKRRMDTLGDEAAAGSKGFGDKAAEAGKSAADATKSAVDAVAKLPTARVMEGRERCVIAPNGAPDCLAAAEALCRKHGFASGKSIDFTSAEECPAGAYVGRQSRDECTTVTFISRAMCQ